MKRFGINLIVFFVSFAIALFAAELILRCFGFSAGDEGDYLVVEMHRSDPRFGHSGAPNWKGAGGVIGSKMKVVHNSKGMREDEISYQNRKGRYRILILGDSFMWGFGVHQDQVFAEQLEKYLNDRGLPAETINAGLSGYSPTQELLWFQYEGVKYQPDLVLLAFFMGNDLEDPEDKPLQIPYYERDETGQMVLRNFPVPIKTPQSYILSNKLRKKKQGVFDIKGFLNGHSILYWRFKLFVKGRRSSLRDFLVKIGVISSLKDQKDLFRNYLFLKNEPVFCKGCYQWTASLIKKMEEVALENKCSFLVIFIPEIYRAESAAWELTQQVFDLNDHYDPHLPTERMIHLLNANKIQYYDLGPEMYRANQQGRKFYFTAGVHWNAEGHQYAASKIGDYLINNRWIEKASSKKG